MDAAMPRGMELAFIVPLVCRSVESYWTKMFQTIKPAGILLNNDEALFGSFENWNVFMQCCEYIAGVPLEMLFVLNPHYEKKIYRDNDFEWYTPATKWEEQLRKEQEEAELRRQAEENIAARKKQEQITAERSAKMMEELKWLKSMNTPSQP